VTAKPRISVLLPCRDAEDTLDEALESLATQTFGAFEVVAVDDGSADGTGDLLEQWAKRDRRVRLIRTPPLGIVAALNAAAAVARGELFARMDADDISLPHRFEMQVDLMDKTPEIAACGTQVRYIPRSIVRDGARRYEQWINSVVSTDEIERDLFVECPIPHPTLMLRSRPFRQIGGYRDRGWPEDYDLILRLWAAGNSIGKVREHLLDWRESSDRLSRTDASYGEDAFRRCKIHYIGNRIGIRNVVVCGAGPVGKAFAVALQSEGHEVAAFVDLDPRKIGQEIHGAPVVHPDAVGEYRGCYFLAAVGSPKGRGELRGLLNGEGLREPEEFCAVA